MHSNKLFLRSFKGKRAFSISLAHPKSAATSSAGPPSKSRLIVQAPRQQSRSNSSLTGTETTESLATTLSSTTTILSDTTILESDAFSRHHIFRPAPILLKFPTGHHTLLPLVLTSNNLVLPQNPWHTQEPLIVGSRTGSGGLAAQERVIPFLVSHDPGDKPIGWLLPEVAAAVSRDHLRHFQRDSASPWEVRYFQDGARVPAPSVLGGGMGRMHYHSNQNGHGLGDYGAEYIQSVSFADWVNEGGRHARSLHVDRLVLEWRRKKVFADLLKGVYQLCCFRGLTWTQNGLNPL